jgi:hypothetical protein
VYITNQGDEEALIADAGYGVRGFGATAGGYFQDADSLTYANVGSGIYKIIGTGTVSFVQNHPEDPSSVIVYAAPEGDESATYTRGSARLTDGVARVALGPTFRWVTNPDIGLTAHVTPRGEPVALSVEAVSTTELVVRGPEGSDAAFDYAVWGLRIGFEEAAILQEKVEGAPIPAMSEHREMYGRRPDVKRFNALERFRGMAGGGAEPVDLRRSGELIAAIGEAFPGEDERPDASAPRSLEPDRIESDARVDPKEVPEAVPPLQPALQPVSEPVVAGDVLVVDRDRPGALRLGRDRADATVIGVALADATADADGGLRALVASYGIVTVRADAGYGAIRPGDLLTTSATPGHAMRAMDALPGTLAGKALDGLEAGTGTIRMVVLLR